MMDDFDLALEEEGRRIDALVKKQQEAEERRAIRKERHQHPKRKITSPVEVQAIPGYRHMIRGTDNGSASDYYENRTPSVSTIDGKKRMKLSVSKGDTTVHLTPTRIEGVNQDAPLNPFFTKWYPKSSFTSAVQDGDSNVQ